MPCFQTLRPPFLLRPPLHIHQQFEARSENMFEMMPNEPLKKFIVDRLIPISVMLGCKLAKSET